MNIIVNGAPLQVEGAELTYEAVVELVGLHGNPSVTYRYAAGPKSEGIMHRGSPSVILQEGTVFNCCHTDNG